MWNGESPSRSQKNRGAWKPIASNAGRWSGDGINTLGHAGLRQAVRRLGNSSHGTAYLRRKQRRDAFA
eukprot:2405442-Pleurochrysis_carterae.AAC.1